MSIGEILRSPGICANGLLVHRFLGRDCQVPLKLKPILFFNKLNSTDLSSRSKKTLLNCPVSAKKYQVVTPKKSTFFPWSTTTAPKAVASPWANHSQISNNLLEWSRKSSDHCKVKVNDVRYCGRFRYKNCGNHCRWVGVITKNPIHTSGLHRNHAISTCRIFPQFFGPRERLQLEHFFQIYSSRKLHFWQKKNVIPPTG